MEGGFTLKCVHDMIRIYSQFLAQFKNTRRCRKALFLKMGVPLKKLFQNAQKIAAREQLIC